MITDFNEGSKKASLLINNSKTSSLTNGETTDITEEEETIKKASDVIYLGQVISFQNQTHIKIERRISNGWKKHWSQIS